MQNDIPSLETIAETLYDVSGGTDNGAREGVGVDIYGGYWRRGNGR